MTTGTLRAPGYRSLFAVPGFPALMGSAMLSRTANRMWEIGLVLYVLERFHSAALAGLTVFLSIMPGLLLSPLAGALLDRHGRRRLIVLDNLVAAAALTSIAALGLSNVLTAQMLLPIVGTASLTFPLSTSGTRSMFPTVIPRRFWDLGNAVDSGSEALSSVIGPAISGGLIGLVGGAWATLATAGVFLLAGAAVTRVPEPERATGERVPLLRAALEGLGYVVRNPTLRGLAVVLSVGNLGYGQLVVILPVLVMSRFGAGAGTVGALWALQGAATVVSGLVVGRLGSERREQRLLSLGFALVAGALLLILLPGWIALVVAMLLVGGSVGPLDIALFSLRQRRTHPALFGRVFAVSMALNFAGMPVGSALAGPLVSHSLTVSLLVAAGFATVATLLCLLLVPRHAPADVVAGSGRN
jgi:MFS family permease